MTLWPVQGTVAEGDYGVFLLLSAFAQESRKVTVRLKTKPSDSEDVGSTQK